MDKGLLGLLVNTHMPMSIRPVGGLRQVRVIIRNQTCPAEGRPKRRWNGSRQQLEILRDPDGFAGIQGDIGHGRVGEAKLNTGFGRSDLMLLTKGKKALAPGELFLIGRLTGIEFAIIKKFTAGEKTGVEDS